MDTLGITYIIDNAQQFWSELEDILDIPNDLTLAQLDATLRQFVSFCASYHEQYLQTPLQLEHSCDLLMSSELFSFHSERMCELLLEDAKKTTDPHCQLILYNVLLAYGRRNQTFIRSHKKWQPLIPLLMDHVRLDLDDLDEGLSVGPGRAVVVPIEAKLRLLSVGLLYEVCRVQKLSLQDLRIFDDVFIEHLFDLVEQTRGLQDETFNYAVIKLIVALNEQFMVAALPPTINHGHDRSLTGPPPPGSKPPEEQNRVLRILMARLSSSPAFGENMIFMLNRAGRSPEDLVMQLLVLKILYLLFTTKGTTDYFYTNDLRVLVDVFLREILDLDEENESLRHTYLRVLHPLLTKTQLKSMPYKRPQIVHALESLVAHEDIRDVNPTTKRLVQRCLSGDWCVQFRKVTPPKQKDLERRVDSPGLHSVSSASSSMHASASTSLLMASVPTDQSGNKRSLKSSRSVENLKATPAKSSHKERSLGESLRMGSNDSSISLPKVASAAANTSAVRRRDRAGSMDVEIPSTSQQDRRNTVLDDTVAFTQEPPTIVVESPFSPAAHDLPQSPLGFPTMPHSAPLVSSLPSSPTPGQRRPAPPPPPRRRKPPAIPTSKPRSGGVTITTIAASSPSSPLRY